MKTIHYYILLLIASISAIVCCYMISQHNRYHSTRSGRILDTQTGKTFPLSSTNSSINYTPLSTRHKQSILLTVEAQKS